MTIERRTLLGAAAVAALGSTIATPALAVKRGAAAKSAKPATYVLVHGGGHGGWCWERVATPLRALGHRVYTPTLTGLADRSHLLFADLNLDTHITDVVNLMKWEDLSDVILVGHSYGGMVITGIADRATDRIRHLVFYDAAHPTNGQSLADIGMSALRAGVHEVNGVQLGVWPDDKLVTGPLGVTKPEDVEWLRQKLTPHPWKTIEQKLVLTNEPAMRKIPTTDIWRTRILNALDPDGTKRKSFADRVWTIDSDCHDLMISDAPESVEMLVRLNSL